MDERESWNSTPSNLKPMNGEGSNTMAVDGKRGWSSGMLGERSSPSILGENYTSTIRTQTPQTTASISSVGSGIGDLLDRSTSPSFKYEHSIKSNSSQQYPETIITKEPYSSPRTPPPKNTSRPSSPTLPPSQMNRSNYNNYEQLIMNTNIREGTMHDEQMSQFLNIENQPSIQNTSYSLSPSNYVTPIPRPLSIATSVEQ
ncbi:4342_t:CDS:1, partial [Acaulospora morrowiae]